MKDPRIRAHETIYLRTDASYGMSDVEDAFRDDEFKAEKIDHRPDVEGIFAQQVVVQQSECRVFV